MLFAAVTHLDEGLGLEILLTLRVIITPIILAIIVRTSVTKTTIL
jgi:hypothetical protein